MPFDLSTAKPVGGFDLSTAKPIDAPAAPAEQPWYQKPIPGIGLPLVSSEGVGADLKRSLGLAARSTVNAVTGLPLAAMDAGTSVRNALSGLPAPRGVIYDPATKSYKPDPNAQGSTFDPAELPSKTWRESLNSAGAPEPTGALEKTADFINQVMVGSRLPAPKVEGTPTGPVTTQPVRDTTLKASQDAGYVVPPSTTNPTITNKILESVGGKIATAQDAAVKNADTTNALVKEALGLHPDAPLTEGALKALRDEAVPAYEAIKKAGTMQADETYTKALDAIGSKYQGASKSFPGLVNDQVTKLVESLNQPNFEADSAVDATKVLRESASKAYASGDKALGSAYKNASKALEDLMERNLAKDGGEKAAETLKNFRDARQLIAKTYSVESALNSSTGNVSATKLAQQLSKGKPLSGPILTAAKFGQAFPRAAQSVTDSGSVRNTDVILGAGTAALSKEKWALLYPFARMAVRKGLLSPTGQQLAVPASGAANMNPTAMGSMSAIAKLLGQ
jgi:hypothetical protein